MGRLRHWLFMVERFGTPIQALLDEMRIEGIYEECAQGCGGAAKKCSGFLGWILPQEASLQKNSEELVGAFLAFSAPSTMDRNFPDWCEDMGMGSGRALWEVLKGETLRSCLESLAPEGLPKKPKDPS